MVALMRLPGYNPGNQLLDLSPINQGFDAINQRRQRDITNARADEQMGMQREQFGMRKQQFESQQKAMQVKTLANRASVIEGMPEGQRQAAWQRMVKASPQLAGALQENGVDPNDHVAGPRMIIAEAGQYDPLGTKIKQAQIQSLQSQTGLRNAQARYYGAKSKPQTATAAPDIVAQGYGLDANDNIVRPGQGQATGAVPSVAPDAFEGPRVDARELMPQGPNVPGVGYMQPPMKLGGPTDDLTVTREDSGPMGVQVAQAGDSASIPGAPSLMEQSKNWMLGQVGVTSPEVPGIVTDAGRNRRMDVNATRQMQGQRVLQSATPEQQERLKRYVETQRLWTYANGRPARSGYFYGVDGREQALAEKNYKGDKETQAVANMHLKAIGNATKTLLGAPLGLPQRAFQGSINQGEIGQAFSDLRQASMGIAYALSGKTVAVAEMKNFMDAYGPQPFDSADRIKSKTQRLKAFYGTLLSAVKGGESYEQAFSKASAGMGAGTLPGEKPEKEDLRNLSTEELLKRLGGG